MTTMLERMAVASYDAMRENGRFTHLPQWPKLASEERAFVMAHVRAGVEAMLPATEGMVLAIDGRMLSPGAVWVVMVDAILAEQQA